MECCGGVSATPLARYIHTAKKCSASTVCHTQKSRQRGRASARSGISQTTNCGEYTLLVSTNAATTRNVSWASRGVCRTRTPSTKIPRQHTAKVP